ncbi:MAG: SCP2 sterol-binding domain-containing protein [Gammaproteobacteria bacterium]|nr:SCP2 sterol-binding domain-containing protein [Gammaproteobacteria bacterium]
MSRDSLLEPLRSLLNRQIERSTPARRQIDALEGRTMAIRLRNTTLTLFMSVVDRQLNLSRELNEDADIILETTPLGLAGMARGTPAGGHMSISGDPVIAQHFQELLRHTSPDWEEELSRLVGDVAAHQLGNVFRGMLAFGQRAAGSFSMNTSEYLREESRDVPARSEIAAFSDAVLTVNEKVDELTQRVDKLRSRLS